MKKLTIGIIIGVAISVSGSVYAVLKLPLGNTPVPTPAPEVIQTPVIQNVEKEITENKVIVPVKGAVDQELSETEKRFRSIEARLNVLEAKQK